LLARGGRLCVESLLFFCDECACALEDGLCLGRLAVQRFGGANKKPSRGSLEHARHLPAGKPSACFLVASAVTHDLRHSDGNVHGDRRAAAAELVCSPSREHVDVGEKVQLGPPGGRGVVEPGLPARRSHPASWRAIDANPK